jgi:hypothetical protein
MTNKPKTNLADIQLLVMDVDGVLTDGTVIINKDGSESKFFNLLDGHGIRMWQRAGGKSAFLSGRFSQATKYRAEQLEVDYCVQPFDKLRAVSDVEPDCFEKLPVLPRCFVFAKQTGGGLSRPVFRQRKQLISAMICWYH